MTRESQSDARQSFLLSLLSPSQDQRPGVTSSNNSELFQGFECLVHLSLMSQLVIKHLSEELLVEEVMYQLEHLPVDVKFVGGRSKSEQTFNNDDPTNSPPPISMDLVSVPVACLRVTYLGRYQKTFKVNQQSDFIMQFKLGLVDWIQTEVPLYLWLLVHQ